MDLGNALLLPMWSDLSQNMFVTTYTTNTQCQWHLGNPYSLILPGDCSFFALVCLCSYCIWPLCIFTYPPCLNVDQSISVSVGRQYQASV